MTKLLIGELGNVLFGRQFALIGAIGFDSRCLSVMSNMGKAVPLRVLGVFNPSSGRDGRDELGQTFLNVSGPSAQLVGKNCRTVIETVDSLQAELRSPDISEGEFVIDITSFSHELLVALIGLLASEGKLKKTTLLYVGASEYSFNTPKGQMWLSRGVTEIRSVLGFPGLMLPSKKLHLIVMAGFEVERASEVILRYEPNRLTIAYGEKKSSVSDAHHESNKEFVDKIKCFLEDQQSVAQNIHHFEFSCVDPFCTANVLIEYVKSCADENIVICPINTKISTVGAVLAALKLPNVQICYAQPAEYNVDGYAKAGDFVTVIPMVDWQE